MAILDERYAFGWMDLACAKAAKNDQRKLPIVYNFTRGSLLIQFYNIIWSFLLLRGFEHFFEIFDVKNIPLTRLTSVPFPWKVKHYCMRWLFLSSKPPFVHFIVIIGTYVKSEPSSKRNGFTKICNCPIACRRNRRTLRGWLVEIRPRVSTSCNAGMA